MDLLNTITGFLGAGFLVYAIILFFAPSAAQVVVEFLKPIAKKSGEFIVDFANILKEGVLDIIDSWKTIVTVVVLSAGIFAYATWDKLTDKSFEERLVEIRKDYKFVKRTPAERRAYLKRIGQEPSWWEGYWPWNTR